MGVGDNGHLPIDIDGGHVDAPDIDVFIVRGQTRRVDIDGESLSLVVEVVPWYGHWPYWNKWTCVITSAGEVCRRVDWYSRIDTGILED